jgi:chitinase
MNMENFTHLIIFAAQDALSSSPYFNVSNLDGGNDLTSIMTQAHAKNVKMIASIVGGYGQTVMPVVAADPVKCQTFVTNACAWAKSKGFDGIELDWEFPRATDSKGWNQLIRMLRIELDKWSPRGILMTSVNYVAPQSPPYYKDSMMVFDQINHMSYCLWMGQTQESPYVSGFDTPINQPNITGYKGTSLNQSGLSAWVSAGYPLSKLGVGLSFESTIFSGVTGLNQSYSAWQFGSTATKGISGNYPSVPTTGRKYDATAQANYCVNGGKLYSFHDTNSVKAIVDFAIQKKYGGIMVYNVAAGLDNATTPSDLLMQTIARKIKSDTVIVPPPVLDTLKTWKNGFYAGVKSVTCPPQIDTNGLWSNYYNQGVSSINIPEIVDQAYKQGRASIDTLAPFNNGKAIGIKQGEDEFILDPPSFHKK